MKHILFITHLNPFENSFGAEQRTNLVLKSFLNIGCKVDICYIGQPSERPKNDNNFCKIVYWNNETGQNLSKLDCILRTSLFKMFPRSIRFSSIVNKLTYQNNYDYIFCRYLPYAAMAGLSKHSEKLLLDIDDMPEQALQIDFSKKNGLKKIYFDMLRRAYRRDTKTWIRKSKACFLPNLSQANQYGCVYLPNISTMTQEHVSRTGNHKVLFVGKMDWAPNAEGVKSFVEEVWQYVINKYPDAEFHIAGKGLDKALTEKWTSEYPSIKYWGFVGDLKAFYELGDIVVCPIYTGAGTNIKIVEAMSIGKVVVVSKESTKGYEHFLVDGVNCLVADNVEKFQLSIDQLFSESKLVESLATTALNQAQKMYSFESFKSVFAEILQK